MNDLVKSEKKELRLKDDGLIDVKNLEDLLRISRMFLESALLPKAYDTVAKIATGIVYIKELGLSPLNGLRNLAVINGTPSLWGELPLAMVRSSGQLEYINEYLIDKNYNKICFENKNLDAEIFAAICELKRKGGEKKTFVYTIADVAKNPNSKSIVWNNYRPIMMKRKARSIGIKDEFGDIIGGMSIAEYDYDTIPNNGDAINVERSKVSSSDQSKLEMFKNPIEEKQAEEIEVIKTNESIANFLKDSNPEQN
jgi:hypothetical protein